MSLYEFQSGVVHYSVLSNDKGPEISDKDFDDILEHIRSFNLPDVKV